MIIRRIKQVSGDHPRQPRDGTSLSDLIAFHESKASACVCSLISLGVEPRARNRYSVNVCSAINESESKLQS